MYIFYTPNINSSEYILNEPESKHIVRVLRLEAGQTIFLVDGCGGFYTAQILNADYKKCQVQIIKSEKCFGLKNYEITIAIAPTKNIDRFEWFLEKATEIGINRIIPIKSRYSERKDIKTDRLEKVIISAMKQSKKAYLPKIDELTDFKELISQPFDGQKFIAHCEELEKSKLSQSIIRNNKYLILIGPEGDFSVEEIELAIYSGYKPVSLGESRLRTETAGVVACHTFNFVNDN